MENNLCLPVTAEEPSKAEFHPEYLLVSPWNEKNFSSALTKYTLRLLHK